MRPPISSSGRGARPRDPSSSAAPGPALALAVLLAAALGCQAPDPRACTVRCGAASACPTSMACGADDYCHEVGAAAVACAAGVDGDGGPDDDDDGEDGGDPPGRIDAGPGDPDAAIPVDCDPLTQSGCPAGTSCSLSGGETFCRATGPGGQGDPCVGHDDCDDRFGCTGDFDAFACRRYCDDEADCPGLASRCALPMELTEIKLCSIACDPPSNGGCAPGSGCNVFFTGQAGEAFTDCSEAGAGVQDDPCATPFDCAAGFTCGGSPPRCRRYCVVGGFEACDDDTFCSALGSHPTIGGIEYGLCL